MFLQALESLLRHIQDIVEKHTNSEVLENCSKVLENFCNEDYGIARKCNVSRSTLIDKLVEKYKDAFQSFFQEVKYFLLFLHVSHGFLIIGAKCGGHIQGSGEAFFQGQVSGQEMQLQVGIGNSTQFHISQKLQIMKNSHMLKILLDWKKSQTKKRKECTSSQIVAGHLVQQSPISAGLTSKCPEKLIELLLFMISEL